MSRLWAGETVDFEGKHLHVEGARLSRLPDPVPDLYFGGSSAAAGPVAAQFSNVYLTWGEPPEAVGRKLRWIDGLAAGEAWRQADRLIEGVDEAMIRQVQEGLATSESEGLRRSSCPGTRTWRRRTGSARACCRSWPPAACGSTRRPRPWTARPTSRRSPPRPARRPLRHHEREPTPDQLRSALCVSPWW